MPATPDRSDFPEDFDPRATSAVFGDPANADEEGEADWHDQMLANEVIQNRNRDVMADMGRALLPENFAKIMGAL